MKCQICLRETDGAKVKIKFNTGRIKICNWCVQDLNDYRETAADIYSAFEDRLKKSISDKLKHDMKFSETRKEKIKAMNDFNNLDEIVKKRLPIWLNGILENSANFRREHKILRAHRRGLVHLNRPKTLGLDVQWDRRAKNIRKIDHFICGICKKKPDEEIHVHHIVYRSNFGTNRVENLVSLCRSCHMKEHDHAFDAEENKFDGSEIISSLVRDTSESEIIFKKKIESRIEYIEVLDEVDVVKFEENLEIANSLRVKKPVLTRASPKKMVLEDIDVTLNIPQEKPKRRAFIVIDIPVPKVDTGLDKVIKYIADIYKRFLN